MVGYLRFHKPSAEWSNEGVACEICRGTELQLRCIESSTKREGWHYASSDKDWYVWACRDCCRELKLIW